MNSDQKELPVVRERVLPGMNSIDDGRRVPREHWEQLTVQEAMTFTGRVHTLSPNDDAYDALCDLAEHDSLPMIDHERLVGAARRADILKWLALHARRT